LAALELAATITVEHVDRVAEAVLRHRRLQRGPHAMPPPSKPPQTTHESPQQPRSEDNESSEGDWGHLPPETVGTTAVKGVIPLPVKKR
jgi:magnesium chelatase subunit I